MSIILNSSPSSSNGISGGIVSSSSSEDFWKENPYGGWATITALLIILIWQAAKFFSTRSRSKPFIPPPPNPSIRISGVVTDADLKILIDNLEEKLDANEKWENVVDKRTNLFSYKAKCCKPKDGPLKYLSVTVFENCSTEMLRDFYMDNDYRKQWDKTVVEHVQLQMDETSGTEIGRTVKKFPLLTPREYILAWRIWEGKNKTFYCFTRECEHLSAPRQKKYVRVGFFRSGWRIRKVPGRNACEIKMAHQEDAGLNVEMAKLAFSRGIWSYVCKMDNALRKYSAISRPQPTPAATAVTLAQKVPTELDTISDVHPVPSSSTGIQGRATGVEDRARKFSRKPSRDVIAKCLLLVGGVVCMSRGHSSLGAKVAMAYILTKLRKRNVSSSQKKPDLRDYV